MICTELKTNLRKKFHVKDLGSFKYFLGIKVARLKHGICCNQRKYALKLVEKLGLSASKTFIVPIDQTMKLTSSDFDNIMVKTQIATSDQ